MKRHLRLVLASALLLPALTRASAAQVRPTPPAGVAVASDSALDAQTSAVASQLRCPVCQGESIDQSPADLARQLRSLVRDQLRAGRTPDEVKAYFVSKYGEWILLQPKTTGMNALIYILPFALLLGGLAAVVIAVRRWTRVPAAAGDTGTAIPSAPSDG